MGPAALEIYNTLTLSTEQKKSLGEVLNAFKEFCAPKKNEVYESFKFWTRNQSEGEPFDEFLMDLKKKIKACNYEDKEERMLRDRIVLGVYNKKLQKRLMEADNLTLGRVIEMARADEISNQQAKAVQKASMTRTQHEEVAELRKLSTTKNYNNKTR